MSDKYKGSLLVDNQRILDTQIDTMRTLDRVFNQPQNTNLPATGLEGYIQSWKGVGAGEPVSIPLSEAIFSDDDRIKDAANAILTDKVYQSSRLKAKTDVKIETPVEQGEKYLDKFAGFNPLINNEQFYYEADNEKYNDGIPFNGAARDVGRFLGRVIVPGILKLGEGIGYTGAMLTSIGSDNYWADVADNGVSKWLEGLEKDFKNTEYFDVYHSIDYDKKGFFKKLIDPTFWTDEVADGVAFMASAFVPGLVASKIGLIGKGGSLFGQATKVQRALNTLGKTLTGSQNWGEASVWAFNTASESAFEAAEFFKEEKKKYITLRDSGVEGYKDLSDDEIDSIVGEKTASVFTGNIAVLGLSSAWENRMLFNALGKTKGKNGLFGPKTDTFTSAVTMNEKNFGFEVLSKTKKGLSKVLDFSQDGRLGFYGKKITEGFVAEGLWEENAQLAIQRINAGEHLYYDPHKGNFFTNFFKQVGTQAYEGFFGDDVEAGTSIGLGALIGSGAAIGISKTLGGADTEGKKSFFKGERKSRIENTEARVAAVNDKLSKFNDLTDIFNIDGSVKADVFNAKQAALKDLLGKQLSLDEVKDPNFKKFLQKKLFADYILPALQLGKFDDVISRLDNIGKLSPEELENQGFDPSNIKMTNIDLIKFAKDLKEEWSNIENLDINPNFAKLKGYSLEDLTSIEADRKRLAFSYKAQGMAMSDLISSKITAAQDIASMLLNQITGASEESTLFAQDIMQYNSLQAEIDGLEEIYISTQPKTENGKTIINNPQPKFYVEKLKRDIEQRKNKLKEEQSKIQEKEKTYNFSVPFKNNRYEFEQEDVQNVVSLFEKAKKAEYLNTNSKDYSDFMSQSFLDKEKGLDNYKDFIANINPIVDKVISGELANFTKKLKDLGYSQEEINKMSSSQIDDILKNKRKKEAPSKPPAEQGPLYDKEGDNRKVNPSLAYKIWSRDKELLRNIKINQTSDSATKGLSYRIVPNSEKDRIKNYEDDNIMVVFEPSQEIIQFYNGDQELGNMPNPESWVHYRKINGGWTKIKLSDLTPEEFGRVYEIGNDKPEERLKTHIQYVSDIYKVKKELVANKNNNFSPEALLRISISRGEFVFASDREESAKLTIKELSDKLGDNYKVIAIIDRSAFYKGDIFYKEAFDLSEEELEKLETLTQSKDFKNKIEEPHMKRYSVVIKTPTGSIILPLHQENLSTSAKDELAKSIVTQLKKAEENNIGEDNVILDERFNDEFNKEIKEKIFIAASTLVDNVFVPLTKTNIFLEVSPKGGLRFLVSNLEDKSEIYIIIPNEKLENVSSNKELIDVINSHLETSKNPLLSAVRLTENSFKKPISSTPKSSELFELKTDVKEPIFKNSTIKVVPLKSSPISPINSGIQKTSSPQQSPQKAPSAKKETVEEDDSFIDWAGMAGQIESFPQGEEATNDDVIINWASMGANIKTDDSSSSAPSNPFEGASPDTTFTSNDNDDVTKLLFDNNIYNEDDKIEKDDFLNFVAKNLPQSVFTIKQVDSLGERMENGGVKVGSFLAMLQTLSDGSKEIQGLIQTTGAKYRYHEAFHGIYRLLMTNAEQKEIIKAALNEIYKELHIKKTSLVEELKRFLQENPRKYEKLSKEDLKTLYVEEWLADRFEEYKTKNVKPKSYLQRLFDIISNFINRILGNNTVNSYFDRIDRGVYKNRKVQQNTYTSKLFEEGFGEIEVNKIKIITNKMGDSNIYGYLSDSDQAVLVGTIFTNFLNQVELGPVNKTHTLNEIMDDIRDSLNPSDITQRGMYSALYFNESRKAIIEEVNKSLEFLGYQSSLESIEYDESADDDGDRKTTDNYSSSENFGGFKSLSKEVRKYLLTLTDFSKIGDSSQTKGGRFIYKQLFVPFVYNGILKATAGTTSTQEFLDRLKSFSEYNDNTKTFTKKFFSDIFKTQVDDLSTFEPRVENISNSKLFNLFKTNFQTFSNTYKIVALETSTKKVIHINANTKNSAKLQFQNWANQFLRSNRDNSTKAKTINKLAKTIEIFEETKTGDIKTKALELSKEIEEVTGINIHPSAIELTLLRFIPVENLTKDQLLFAKLYVTIPSISREDIVYIANSISRGENPFLAFFEASENGEVDLTSTGAATRIKNLALTNANFNEMVWDSVFVNAENEKVWTHQNPTYNTTILQKIKKGDYIPVNSWLYENSQFKEVLPYISLFRNGGNKTVILDDKGQINEKLEINKRKGATFGSLKTAQLYQNLFSNFLDFRRIGNVVVTPHLTRILEASNTGDMVELPFINTMTNDFNLTDDARSIFHNQFEKEARRIIDVVYEIATGTQKELIVKYNQNLNDRGTKFFNMREIIGENYSSQIETQIKEKILKDLEEDPNAKKPQLDDILRSAVIEKLNNAYGIFVNNHVENLISNLIEEGLVSIKEGKLENISLPNEYVQPSKGVMSALGFVKNALKLNIAKVAVDDFINTMMYNDMIFEQEVEYFKDAVDMIKRAKGLNAGGPSIYSEIIDPNLGIFHPTTKMDIIVKPTIEYFGIHKGDKQDRMDAESYITEKMFRHIMFALGRLDKHTASIYDRIINGEENVDDVFGENGLISYNRQTSVLKLVYFDGTTGNYIKTSSLVLTKKLSSYKDSNGEWKPLPHREELHKLREEMEDLERGDKPENGKLVWAVTSSASKMKTVLSSIGEFNDLKGNESSFRKDVSMEYLRLQSENPSNKTELNNPSQEVHIIDTEIDETDSKALTLAEEYQQLEKQRSKVAYLSNRNAIFKMKALRELDKAINLKEVSVDLDAFREMAVETLKKTGASSATIDFFEKGFNLNSPVVREKFEQLLASLISKNGFKAKHSGFTLTLATDYGIKLVKKAKVVNVDGKRIVTWEVVPTHIVAANPEAYQVNGNKKYSTPNYSEAKSAEEIEVHRQSFLDSLNDGDIFIDELQHNVPVYDENYNIISHYSEIVVPPHHKEIAEMIERGQNIPTEYLEGLGIRIPSQDRHSFLTIRIVDFAPSNLGSTVFAPKELIEISGADFDVDKLYTKMNDLYFIQDEEGNYQVRKYGDNPTIEEYVLWNIENNDNLKSLIKKLREESEVLKRIASERANLNKQFKLLPEEKQKIKDLIALKNRKVNEVEQIEKLYKKYNIDYTEIIDSDSLNDMISRIEYILATQPLSILEKNKLQKDLSIVVSISSNISALTDLSNIEGTKKYIKGLTTRIENLYDKKDEKYERAKELTLELQMELDRIEKEAFETLNLPYNQREYNSIVQNHGTQNIGQINNESLHKQVLLQSSEWVVKNKVDSETASLDMFREFENDPVLSKYLNQDPNINPNSIIGKIKHQKTNKEGSKNIGPAVNAMLVYTLFHKYRVSLTKPFVFNNRSYAGYDSTRTTDSSNKRNSGRRIFNIISQVVTAMTDNAKERIAYKFNLPFKGIGAYVHMISLGMNERLVQALYLNPEVKQYLKEIEREGASKNNIRDKYLKAYDSKNPIELTETDILSALNPDYNNQTIQSNIMAFLFERENEAEIAFPVNKILKLIKGLTEGLDMIDIVNDSLEELGYNKEEQLVQDLDDEDSEEVWSGVTEAIKSHFSSQFVDQLAEFEQLSKLVAIRTTSMMKKTINAILLNSNVSSYEKAARTRDIINTMLSFFSIKHYQKNYANKPLTKLMNSELLIGKDNIVSILNKAKSEYVRVFGEPSVLLEKYTTLNPKEVEQRGIVVKNPNNKANFNLVQANTWTNFDESEMNRIHDEFHNMIKAVDEKGNKIESLQKAALAMYAYTIVKDGHMFKSNGLLNFIPVDYMKNFVNSNDVLQNVFIQIEKTKDIRDVNDNFKTLFETSYGQSFLSLIDEFFSTYLEDFNNKFYSKRVRSIFNEKVSSKQGDDIKIDLMKNIKQRLSIEEYNILSKQLGKDPEFLKTGNDFRKAFKENLAALKAMGFRVVKDLETGHIKVFFPRVVKVELSDEGEKTVSYFRLKAINGSEDLKSQYTNNFLFIADNAVYERFTPKGNGYLASTHRLFGEIVAEQSSDEYFDDFQEEISNKNQPQSPSKPDNVKGKISMKIINEWVKEGKATTTVRGQQYHNTFYKGDGIYETDAGDFVNLEYRGLVSVVDDKIVGKGFEYTKDEFGKAEGFNNWEGFLAGAKYAGKNLINGESVHLYNVTPYQSVPSLPSTEEAMAKFGYEQPTKASGQENIKIAWGNMLSNVDADALAAELAKVETETEKLKGDDIDISEELNNEDKSECS